MKARTFFVYPYFIYLQPNNCVPDWHTWLRIALSNMLHPYQEGQFLQADSPYML